ncbi:MAG: hypothetical protein Q4C01_03725 [Clostridia bacterium]|nr:hypothetical protein [Clostridia bacterium]
MQVSKRYRYTEDYETIPYVGANGRAKQKIRYIGKYVQIQNDEAEALKTLKLVRWLGIAAVALAAVAMVIEHSASRSLYVAAIMMLNLFPLAYMIMGGVAFPRKIEPMERIKYAHSISRVEHSALGLLIITAASIVGYVCFWIFEGEKYMIEDAIFSINTPIVSCISFFIFKKLKSLKTELIPNDAVKKR